MFDFNRLEETIIIESHKTCWINWYNDEIKELKTIFGKNVIEFAHFGSSVVPQLLSKPIVDILVGLNFFEISELQIEGLVKLEYEYFGQLHENQERFFARKRKERNFNLSIVPFQKEEWIEKIAFRDYLTSHPEKVEIYSKIKKAAIELDKNSLLAYHKHKEEVVAALLKEAMTWRGL